MTKRRLYCWFDTEYTTLELEKARLLEVALIVTDETLVPVRANPKDVPESCLKRDGFSAFLSPPDESEMSDHVRANYQPLLARCRSIGRSPEEVDDWLSRYMDSFAETRSDDVRKRPVLAGNSIYADYFLSRKYLPRFLSHLSYRLLDVTSLKLEWVFHYHGEKFEKLGGPAGIRKLYRGEDPIEGDKHDAYYDVQASIAELAFYRSQLKKV